MHCHQSIWKGGKPVFRRVTSMPICRKSASLTLPAFIKHAGNQRIHQSHHKLVQAVGPGLRGAGAARLFARNRSASCRIPYTTNPKAKRVEVRFPDPLANPYLAFAAMLMAGLDGIKNKLDPGSADR